MQPLCPHLGDEVNGVNRVAGADDDLPGLQDHLLERHACVRRIASRGWHHSEGERERRECALGLHLVSMPCVFGRRVVVQGEANVECG